MDYLDQYCERLARNNNVGESCSIARTKGLTPCTPGRTEWPTFTENQQLRPSRFLAVS